MLAGGRKIFNPTCRILQHRKSHSRSSTTQACVQKVSFNTNTVNRKTTTRRNKQKKNNQKTRDVDTNTFGRRTRFGTCKTSTSTSIRLDGERDFNWHVQKVSVSVTKSDEEPDLARVNSQRPHQYVGRKTRFGVQSRYQHQNTQDEEWDLERVKILCKHQYAGRRTRSGTCKKPTSTPIRFDEERNLACAKSQCQHQYTGRRTRYGTCKKPTSTPIRFDEERNLACAKKPMSTSIHWKKNQIWHV